MWLKVQMGVGQQARPSQQQFGNSCVSKSKLRHLTKPTLQFWTQPTPEIQTHTLTFALYSHSLFLLLSVARELLIEPTYLSPPLLDSI